MQTIKKDLRRIYTKKDIIAQLEQMGAPRDSVVLMHSSLRSVGAIEGGAQALLDAMVEYFTAEGGLFCVPTHTWGFMNEEITLDVTSSRNCLGAFSTVAAEDGRGIRSDNATHSMVVFGDRERALRFIADEWQVGSGTAPESCYGKIYSEGGSILLVGVGHNRNTYLHSVSELLGMQNRLAAEPSLVRVRLADGAVVERRIRPHSTDYTRDISLRFPKYETAFRYHGCITDGYIGNAPTQLCDAVGMKKVIELILERNGGEDPLRDEAAIPQSLYCYR